MRLNEIAAEIHRRMCEDERFGYSWEERYGDSAQPEVWEIDGKKYRINVGDYECGTSVKTAWAMALQGTPYEGALDSYGNSTTARRVFTESGLFDWLPAWQAELGDPLVNEANHVAMRQGDGRLSEFSWGDNGAYGNQRGDQSGRESYIGNWYEYPWDGCLHYNGRYESEDDMAAPDVWNYGLKSFKGIVMSAGDRLVDIQKFFYDTFDYSGRGKEANFVQRICWGAAKQEKQNDLLVAIAEKVGIDPKKAREMLDVEPSEEEEPA